MKLTVEEFNIAHPQHAFLMVSVHTDPGFCGQPAGLRHAIKVARERPIGEVLDDLSGWVREREETYKRTGK